MKKRISRKKTRLCIVLLAAFAVVFLVGAFIISTALGLGIALMIVSAVLLIGNFILLLSTNRCPHCGAVFRGLRWSKPTAGYCSSCGKRMEFDDQ